MNKLIKNEFKKLFSKKVMYILFLITIGFTVLTNVLYNIDIDVFNNDEYNQQEIAYMEEELRQTDYKLPENTEYYIDLKTDYDIFKLKINYDNDTWQYNFINSNDTIYDILRNINKNTYGTDKNDKELKVAQEEYKKIKQKLDLGDWKGFINEEIQDSKEQIAFYENQLKTIKDKKVIEEINNTLEIAKADKEALEWRADKNIPYNTSNFLSNKVEDYIQYFRVVNSLKNVENKTADEKKEYDEAIKQMNISKYYIENNINIEKEYNARYVLINLFTEYGMFISVFAIIVAGTIVSSEFQKGTIKLLLTRPYSRTKTLLAKYIVSLVSLVIFVAVFAIAQYIIGGIVSGFDVFNVPVIEYNLNTNSIVVMSVIRYLMLITLSKLPIYILLLTLAFGLSTITMNSAVSIAIPILGYMISTTINLFINRLKILKYFVTTNWDLSTYLFGGKGMVEGLNLSLSIVICIIYLVIMLVTTFVVFNKRDIKNV